MVATLNVVQQRQLEPVVPWEDITCVLWHNDLLFTTVTSCYNNTTTGCNGKLNVWDKDLNPLGEFRAHEYGIYHMCTGPGNTFYTCCSDSTICHWQCPPEETPHANLALDDFKQLSSLRGHLEPPWKMQFFEDRLFSGDELGEIRLWEDDKYKGTMETYEEIWDMVVIKNMIFTVRHIDVTITAIPDKIGKKKACSIKNTVPGRGPLFISGDNMICLNRTNFDIMVYSIYEMKNPIVKVLQGHNCLVNGFVGTDTVLFSGDYEGRVIAWDLKELVQIAEIHLKDNGCVNAMAISTEEKVLYIAQEKKVLSKIAFTTDS